MSSKNAWRKMRKQEWSNVHTASEFFKQHYEDVQNHLSKIIDANHSTLLMTMFD